MQCKHDNAPLFSIRTWVKNAETKDGREIACFSLEVCSELEKGKRKGKIVWSSSIYFDQSGLHAQPCLQSSCPVAPLGRPVVNYWGKPCVFCYFFLLLTTRQRPLAFGRIFSYLASANCNQIPNRGVLSHSEGLFLDRLAQWTLPRLTLLRDNRCAPPFISKFIACTSVHCGAIFTVLDV